MVDLVDVASLPALLLGDVCLAVWESVALQFTETVRDSRCRVSAEKQGHQGHSPSTFETELTWGMGVERAHTTSRRDEFSSDLNLALRRFRRTSAELGYRPCHTCDGLFATYHPWVSNRT